MRITSILLVLGLAALVVPVHADPAARGEDARARFRLEPAGTYEPRLGKGTEVISIQRRTGLAVVSNSERNIVDVIDLSEPKRTHRIGRHELPAHAGEEMTSVAFHPTEPYYLAVLKSAKPRGRGRVFLVAARTGEILGTHEICVGPDDVLVDPRGRTAVIPGEAESYWRDPDTGRLLSEPGTITVLDLRPGPAHAHVHILPLPDLTGVPGITQRWDHRYLERPVDMNGDGKIEGGEEAIRIRLDATPMHLEPEYVGYAIDGSRAYVTLQENNGIVVLDPLTPRVLRVFGLGATKHAADLKRDGNVSFTDTLLAFREPDGITVTWDGKYLVTADEGDTAACAPATIAGMPTGGGRTLSVWDAATGTFLGDTGSQIDEAAHRAGVYPDHRSEHKGSEPEVGVAFDALGQTWVVATLEWASALVLVSLEDPRKPTVHGVYPLGEGRIAPEVIDGYLTKDGRAYVFSANEISGEVSIFRLRAD